MDRQVTSTVRIIPAGMRPARSHLTSLSSFVRTMFDRAAVSKLLDDHSSGDRNEQPRIWTLLSLEVWHRELVKKMTCDEDPLRSVAR